MNIFILDDSPYYAALAQHDRHVVKMVLESAQMLSTACHSEPMFGALVESHHQQLLYKPTHLNHPCSIWTRETPANFVWLTTHATHLVGEYMRRFRKTHATYPLLVAMQQVSAKLCNAPRFWTRDSERNLVIDPMIHAVSQNHTPFVFAGPAHFAPPVTRDVISAYRSYYLAEKVAGNRWTNPIHMPSWLESVATIHIKPLTVERVVAKPHVPAGMAIPSFLRPNR